MIIEWYFWQALYIKWDEWFSAGYLLTGPFTSNEMTEWFSAGYFITNLQGKEAVMKIKSPMGLYLL